MKSNLIKQTIPSHTSTILGSQKKYPFPISLRCAIVTEKFNSPCDARKWEHQLQDLKIENNKNSNCYTQRLPGRWTVVVRTTRTGVWKEGGGIPLWIICLEHIHLPRLRNVS